MRWRPTLYLGTWSGVEVRLDLIVVALIGLLFLNSINNADVSNTPIWSAIAHLMLLLVMLFCMFGHELGHALMCKLRGHQPSMILLSFVGLTFFKTVKAKPRDEFWIAIAGPMVNLGIAVATAPFIFLALADPHTTRLFSQQGMATFLGFMAWISMLNFGVAFLNMLPGWPADGARAIRGFMARKWGYGAATVRAVSISHGFWLIMAGLAVILMTIAPMVKWFVGNNPSQSPASLVVMYNILFLVFAVMGLYYGHAEKRRVARLGAEQAEQVVGPPPEFMPGKRKEEKIIDAEVVTDDKKQEPGAQATGPEPPKEPGKIDELKDKASAGVAAGKALWTVAKVSGKGVGWFAKQGTRMIGGMLADKDKNYEKKE
ncbi:MAG: hypothetical protein KF696_05530 [Planctomycetes bacterium]|nr:hypothetical protein [Planctomycetota bacterium]MCW8136347.1 hypothetical protein [Planctomycetota bacterium]